MPPRPHSGASFRISKLTVQNVSSNVRPQLTPLPHPGDKFCSRGNFVGVKVQRRVFALIRVLVPKQPPTLTQRVESFVSSVLQPSCCMVKSVEARNCLASLTRIRVTVSLIRIRLMYLRCGRCCGWFYRIKCQ